MRQAPLILVCLLLVCLLCPAQTRNSADRLDTSNATANAPVNQSTYEALTEGDRAREYLKDMFNPLSLVSSAASAGLGQWRDSPRQWKQGGEGYGLRYGSSYAEHIVRDTVMYGAASALHEDNRYVRSGQTGVGSRVGYAVSSTFLARGDDGSRRFSFSRMLAFAGAAVISRLWQPRSTNSLGSAAVNFGTSIGVATGLDVAREFWPHK
ncbi:MAG TPA: hypothetical protein VNY05_36425 [Candidatus Acidoferrales bacterium]|jgi:hypothetical protein|nr:hypothetical protein [Candidatus Acidoferrales bacterium]